MNTRILRVMDCVGGTSTNTEGLKLFYSISNVINNGEAVKLSLDGCTPMSSSFMNSSFGELVDKYGIQKVKENLSLVDFKPSQAKEIKNYLDIVSRLAVA